LIIIIRPFMISKSIQSLTGYIWLLKMENKAQRPKRIYPNMAK